MTGTARRFLVAAVALSACGQTTDGSIGAAPPTAPVELRAEAEAAPAGGTVTSPSTVPAADTDPADPHMADPRPAWLGTRVLPIGSDGFGVRAPTPPELVDRRLETPPLPEPRPPGPPGDGSFRASIEPVPRAVAARSTWSDRCPVPLEDLRYLTVTFVGFDGRSHTGELIVHQDVTDAVVSVFRALHAERFPIEEVRVIASEELTAAPTGDGNVTSAFVCRPTVGGSRWSDHAFGRAIDVNPFHNPYVRGDLVLPELAGAYVDREDVRPGMVVAGDAVTRAFAGVGWGWGGDWTGPARDPMHFSRSGR
jgi:hypothetical protein